MYHASDMILACHSDSSYLSETKARSQAGGYLFLSENDKIQRNNGEVLNIALIIKVRRALVGEAWIGAMYINAFEAASQIIALIEMGNPQPMTPMQTNKLDEHSIVMKNTNPIRTKSMDIHFHWLRCRDSQGYFRYYWQWVKQNLAD